MLLKLLLWDTLSAIHNYKPASYTYHPFCSFSPKIPNNQHLSKDNPCSDSISKQCQRVSLPMLILCGRCPSVREGQCTVQKCPRAEQGDRQQRIFLYYISICLTCLYVKAAMTLKISKLFPLKAHLPVIRMYNLIKISNSPEVLQFPLTMNGMSPNVHWKTWTHFLDMLFTHNPPWS